MIKPCRNPATCKMGGPEPHTHRYLSLPDPEVGTRLEWIAWKLGTGPKPGSDEWKAQQASG